MLSQCAKRCLPLVNHFSPQVQIISRSAYQVPGNNSNYETKAMSSIMELKELKVFKSLIMKVDYQLKNYHFPNSVRKHVMTRSTLPSIKTKQYINKTKARLENEHLQKVCDTTIDPMNRYNGHYSLYSFVS